jgi:hypothetical protein
MQLWSTLKAIYIFPATFRLGGSAVT